MSALKINIKEGSPDLKTSRILVMDPAGGAVWRTSRHWLVMCSRRGKPMRTEIRKMVRDDVAAVTDKVVAAEMKNETLIERMIEMRQRHGK